MTRTLTGIASRCLCATPCTFPQMLEKIERMAEDQNCPVALLGSVILSDPMFTALLLGRSNVGKPPEEFTVTNAIARLGMGSMLGLAREMRPVPKGLHGLLAQFWAQANACAVMCELLACFVHCEFDERTQPEILLQIGLLHELGKLIAIRHFGSELMHAEQACEEERQPFEAAFKAALGLGSAHLGALVARAWHLPENIQSAIRWHRSPGKATRDLELAALVHIAHILTKACGFTVGNDIYVEILQSSALSTLGLRQNDLHTCIKRFFEQQSELSLYEGAFTGRA